MSLHEQTVAEGRSEEQLLHQTVHVAVAGNEDTARFGHYTVLVLVSALYKDEVVVVLHFDTPRSTITRLVLIRQLRRHCH